MSKNHYDVLILGKNLLSFLFLKQLKNVKILLINSDSLVEMTAFEPFLVDKSISEFQKVLLFSTYKKESWLPNSFKFRNKGEWVEIDNIKNLGRFEWFSNQDSIFYTGENKFDFNQLQSVEIDEILLNPNMKLNLTEKTLFDGTMTASFNKVILFSPNYVSLLGESSEKLRKLISTALLTQVLEISIPYDKHSLLDNFPKSFFSKFSLRGKKDVELIAFCFICEGAGILKCFIPTPDELSAQPEELEKALRSFYRSLSKDIPELNLDLPRKRIFYKEMLSLENCPLVDSLEISENFYYCSPNVSLEKKEGLSPFSRTLTQTAWLLEKFQQPPIIKNEHPC